MEGRIVGKLSKRLIARMCLFKSESVGYGNIFYITRKSNFEYGYPTNKKHNEEVMAAILKGAPHLAPPVVISSEELKEIQGR
jgi:hypothetical protein